MKPNDHQRQLLRNLPGVDRLLECAKGRLEFSEVPPTVVSSCIRSTLDRYRRRILSGEHREFDADLSLERILDQVAVAVKESMRMSLRPVVNATGVVVHTNLGRSLLAESALENLRAISSRYSNLEYDLAAGARGSRYSHVEKLVCDICGAEAAMVVNNNAGAVLICLETLAKNRNVLVSRGELVEIGGSFRVPDIMAKSGCILKEVGTTNRTHLRDYENAVDRNTALLMKVHRSNFSIVGFTKEVSLRELVALGAKHRLPVMEDLGSGTFIDFSKYGLMREPTVQDSITAGVDVVTFSGDKLLGGPQAGFIVGKTQLIERIRSNPINRALRIDKLTLAALESTLRLYRREEQAVAEIPTLRMITESVESVKSRAEQLARLLERDVDAVLHIELIELSSKVGGGALPLLEVPSMGLKIVSDMLSANKLEASLRLHTPPIIGRIDSDAYIVDPRTLSENDIPLIVAAFKDVLDAGPSAQRPATSFSKKITI